jgi:hypothetical protein
MTQKDCPFQIVQQSHNGKQNCCSIIFNSKNPCDDAQVKRLFTPLEITFPKIFGNFDKQQQILAKIAPPVNVLENAADFIRCMKEQPNFLENIIHKIIDDNKSDFIFLGSETVPLLIKEDTHKIGYKYNYERGSLAQQYKFAADKLRDSYDLAVARAKQKLQKGKDRYILHIGGDFGKHGGHYAIAIMDGRDLILYDSMQKNSGSYYTPFFTQVAQDVFGKMPFPIPHKACAQPTGGFVVDEDDEYALQNIDSQNHYCFMWAIWYFHIVVTKGLGGVTKVFEDMRGTRISLVYIKKYIWSIIMYMYPSDAKLKKFISTSISEDRGIKLDANTVDFLLHFFLMNFRYIWFDCVEGKFHLFSIIGCDISKFRSFKNINECLVYSLTNEPLVLDKFT